MRLQFLNKQIIDNEEKKEAANRLSTRAAQFSVLALTVFSVGIHFTSKGGVRINHGGSLTHRLRILFSCQRWV